MYSAGIESFITLQSVWSIWPANASFAGVSKSPRNETAGGSRLYHTTSFSFAVAHFILVSSMATRVLSVRLGQSVSAELQRVWLAADCQTVSQHFQKALVGSV